MGFSNIENQTDNATNNATDNTTDNATNITSDITQFTQIIESNKLILEDIKQLHQHILDIKKLIGENANKIETSKTLETLEILDISNIGLYNNLSDLIIKTIVSRVENMLKFTAQFYTYILEMAPAIIIFLIIIKYMLFEC